MSSSTEKGYPYPEDTDLVTDAPLAIKALALAVDQYIGRAQGGYVNLDSTGTLDIQFIRPFTGVPFVVACTASTTAAAPHRRVACGNITQYGFTLTAERIDQTPGDGTYCWIAVG